MLGKKEELPPPPQAEINKEEIQTLQQIKASHEEELKKFEDVKQQAHKEQVEAVKNDLGVNEVTNEQLVEVLREFYSLISNRFDQIYFKIDQTQDLILQKSRTKEKGV